MPFWSWTRTTQEEDEDSEDESYTTSDDDENDDDRINENYDGEDDDEEEGDLIDEANVKDKASSRVTDESKKEMNDSSDEILEPQEFASLLQMSAADLSMEKEIGVASIMILDEKIRRERIPSAMSDDIVDNGTRQQNLSKEEEEELEDVPITQPVFIEKEQEGDDAAPQNLQDLYSLFLLAIEADRVDILQELLQSTSNTDPGTRELLINPVMTLSNDTDAAVESTYCCTSIPPLHIAVSYGSMNAINYLLRVGANPAVRPDVGLMIQQADAAAKQVKDPNHISSVFMLDVPHIQKYDQLTAWELAFGLDSTSSAVTPELQKKSSWLFGNGSSSKSNSASSLPPLKRESIRHAFLAEAIRCISNDDIERLRQLLDAGMPSGDVSDPSSSLLKWCTDFHAAQCLNYLQPLLNPPSNDNPELSSPTSEGTSTSASQPSARKLFLESGGSSLVALQNRRNELDALCRSLSLCLDNVAEEVSVGAGLLLQASGAQALASHVRSVKHQRQQMLDEYERYQDAYQNSLDELVYYIQQYQNQNGMRYPPVDDAPGIHEWWSEHMGKSDGPSKIVPQSTAKSPSVPSEPDASLLEDEDEQRHRQQIITQIMMCENKIRMLRAAIADLSDENVRNLEEIERRGLMGGIDYIRTLREEMREVEYLIQELKQLDVDCRTKIRTLQIQMNSSSALASNGSTVQQPVPSVDSLPPNLDTKSTTSHATKLPKDDMAPSAKVESSVSTNGGEILVDSKRIQQGQSTALVVHGPTRGFLSLNLWQILLRIIGISNHRNVNAASSSVASKGPSSLKSDNDSNGGGSTSARSVIII
jgi:hypothetical protein